MSNKSKTELDIFIKSLTIEIIECCGIVGMDFIIIDMEPYAFGSKGYLALSNGFRSHYVDW